KCWLKKVETPTNSKPFCTTASALTRTGSRPCARPRLSLTPIISRTFHVRAWKYGMLAARSNTVSALSKISLTQEWITSRFAPSAKTSTNNSGFIWRKFFPLWDRRVKKSQALSVRREIDLSRGQWIKLEIFFAWEYGGLDTKGNKT